MILSLIAAIGRNNELGKGNDLIWKLPADQKFFRETTTGHPMIMGRKTFESLPGILPNREHIVITRDKTYSKPGIKVVSSLEEAVAPFNKTDQEVFVIGGGEIFNQAIKVADRLYITHVDAEDKKAEVFFPEIIPIVWNEVSHTEHKKDAQNSLDFTISVYERFI
jgi:dihydrofolate reductase